MPLGVFAATSSFSGILKYIGIAQWTKSLQGTSEFSLSVSLGGPVGTRDRAEEVTSPPNQKVVTEPHRIRREIPGTPRECYPKAASRRGLIKLSFLWSKSFQTLDGCPQRASKTWRASVCQHIPPEFPAVLMWTSYTTAMAKSCSGNAGQGRSS